MWHHGMGFSMGQWFPGYGIIGFCLNILFIIAIIALVVRLFRSDSSKPNENRDTLDSLDILKKRLANGEINEEEFHRIKQQL